MIITITSTTQYLLAVPRALWHVLHSILAPIFINWSGPSHNITDSSFNLRRITKTIFLFLRRFPSTPSSPLFSRPPRRSIIRSAVSPINSVLRWLSPRPSGLKFGLGLPSGNWPASSAELSFLSLFPPCFSWNFDIRFSSFYVCVFLRSRVLNISLLEGTTFEEQRTTGWSFLCTVLFSFMELCPTENCTRMPIIF